MKHLLSILILLGLMSVASASNYQLYCEEGEWKGRNIITNKNSEEIKFVEVNPQYSTTIINFTLPAKVGDKTAITYGDSNYLGTVSYFYDADRYLEDQSYIVIESKPKDILEKYVIMIDSGWTHFSYSMMGGTIEEDALVSINNAKKCKLKNIND